VHVLGSFVLATDPTQVCFQGYHTAAFVIGLFVLVLYIIGLPLGLFAILYTHKKDDKTFLRTFGYIYDSFFPNSYFTGILWIVVLLFQGISFSLNFYPLPGLLISVLTLGFFDIFLAVRRPFRRLVVNYLAISLVVFVIVIEIFSYVHLTETAYLVTAIVFFGACMLIVAPLVLVPVAAYVHNVYYLRSQRKESSRSSLAKEGMRVSDIRFRGLEKRESAQSGSQMEMKLFSPSNPS